MDSSNILPGFEFNIKAIRIL